MQSYIMLIRGFSMAGLAFALPTREPSGIQFHISNFTAGCTPHSIFCSLVPLRSPLGNVRLLGLGNNPSVEWLSTSKQRRDH
ncbi:hypothetical protein GGS26DRAFT_430757 [Hypomontagnella submonticulosa]|nr:hypothetical protein GGS26DRAFT_430757 [Hypomontagnella submonticulosa]